MAKTILKMTETKMVVKLHGTTLNETITLNSDCLSATQALTVGGTPTVNIIGLHWTGTVGGTGIITRGGTVIFNISGDSSNSILFNDQEFVDNIQNTSNIVVTGTGTMQIYLVLRKASGYSSKIETAQFSVYDDTSVVGS